MSTTRWEAVLTMPVTEDRDHIRGPADAPVTLVQYGDYECPYCGAAYPIIKEVQARMGERLRFVFRNFPITTSHPHAQQAAEAAEAAAAGASEEPPLSPCATEPAGEPEPCVQSETVLRSPAPVSSPVATVQEAAHPLFAAGFGKKDRDA